MTDKIKDKIKTDLKKALDFASSKEVVSKLTPKKLKMLKMLLKSSAKAISPKPKPTTKNRLKSGGRLSEGTAFIKSLYKDKL